MNVPLPIDSSGDDPEESPDVHRGLCEPIDLQELIEIRRHITVDKGCLFWDGRVVGLPEADNIARKLGFLYVERLISHLERPAI